MKGFKRYLVFVGLNNYTNGGMNEFVNHTRSLRKARDMVKNELKDTDGLLMWWQIFDTHKMDFVEDYCGVMVRG